MREPDQLGDEEEDEQRYRAVFFTGPPLKVLSVKLHSKSHQKSSKCQNFVRVWHLVVFWADQ